MAEGTAAGQAASIRQRLLNLARAEGRVYDVILVRYALERILHRLSISDERHSFILKGGMLVTLWVDTKGRETRDADFLGFGDSDIEGLKARFAGILSIPADDGLAFDVEDLTAVPIRDDMEYGGVRIRTTVYLDRTRIPVTLDIGFGDALAGAATELDYPSLLGMDTPRIRAYPPETVIAEKFQAMVALGAINSRMKDYFDLWAIPRSIDMSPTALDRAIAATFSRRGTEIPVDRPPGLSSAFAADETRRAQWRAYARATGIESVELAEVIDAAWALVEPSCQRLTGAEPKEG